MPRLRRTAPSDPGWRRVRSGRGFRYLDATGAPIRDQESLTRIRSLVIPPAWREVWITPYPTGHLQAVGIDAKGRRQYLYHPAWREHRDRLKFESLPRFARALPAARLEVGTRLAEPDLSRDRVLAAAFRLLDLGLFRIGGEAYAEENGSFGLATVRRDHVVLDRADAAHFHYPAKSGQDRSMTITDPAVLEVLRPLRRRRGGGDELLAYRERGRWRDVTSADISAAVKELVHTDASAKDFRTWHGTVLAAAGLAHRPATSATARQRAIAQVMCEVAEHLGNTPAVCRASYVDPRVVDHYREGTTIARARRADTDRSPIGEPRVERAVLRLLTR